jgi:hypothetical protein
MTVWPEQYEASFAHGVTARNVWPSLYEKGTKHAFGEASVRTLRQSVLSFHTDCRLIFLSLPGRVSEWGGNTPNSEKTKPTAWFFQFYSPSASFIALQ